MENTERENRAVKRVEVVGKGVAAYLNPHLLQFENVVIKEKNAIYYIDAVDLLNSKRIDLIIKYLYAKFRILGLDSKWAKEIYLRHIEKLNGFFEGDGSGKIGKDAFLEKFDQLIDQLNSQGFDSSLSIIPIYKDLTVIDGSHRVGASLFHNLELACLCLENFSGFRFDFDDLKKDGFDIEIQDMIALEYCKLKSNTYVVTIFPVAKGQDEKIKSILEKYSTIIYEKEILFAHRVDTHTHLIRELYFQDSWIGSWDNQFEGAKQKGQACFKIQGKTRIFLIESPNLEQVKTAKLQIRDLFGELQDSVHINDNHEETVHLAQIYFNKNSIHLVNHITLKQDQFFNQLLEEFRNWVKLNSFNLDYFCVDGSGVLSAYGIRNARDLDILHHSSMSIDIKNESICSHNSEKKYHVTTIDDLVFNPENYLYYCGLKFVSIDTLKMMKIKRNEGKDIEDVNLINQKIGLPYQWTMILSTSLRRYSSQLWLKFKTLVRKVKAKIKNKLIRFNQQTIKMMVALQDRFKPYIRTLKYQNFILFYSQGTSIIEINGNPTVRLGGIYEPQESQILANWLTKIQEKEPIFLDIGANIGLISLNVLSSVPNTQIYAFEPGEHQAMLLEKTIQVNHLEDKIILSKKALSKESGKALFAVHQTQDCSGDGLLDTQRAGETVGVEVELETLDQWWKSMNCPLVDVMKIDTEGAELWILQGGEEMLKSCSPKILIEINITNLKVYPYNCFDIIKWLKSIRYTIRNLQGKPINQDNILVELNSCQSFQCILSCD